MIARERSNSAVVAIAGSVHDPRTFDARKPQHFPGQKPHQEPQGIVWPGMWIAATSGVHHDEQGIAIGLSVLIALATPHISSLEGAALLAAVTEGTQRAFWLAAAGILVSLVAAFALPMKKAVAA